MNNYDVIIIGAGAAGLMCAAIANKRNKKILLIEHTKNIGEKIRISGGGRCNFTNIYVNCDKYLSKTPQFAQFFLTQYSASDFIKLVEKHKISYFEKSLGQLFCDHSSKQIIEMLISETKPNTTILTNCTVTQLSKTEKFNITTSMGELSASSLVIATGGLSIPKIGASSFGYDIAKQFGIKITPLRPALVPLISEETKNLAGISIDSIASFKEMSFHENMLFTHKGLSGPSILQISSYLYDPENSSINLNFSPENNLEKILLNNKDSKLFLHNILKTYLPNRFVEHYFSQNKKLAEYKNKDLINIATAIHSCKIKILGTEGYSKAEVTAGGIDIDELSNTTLVSKKVPGLYFIGELIDVTGWLGGYNFQWAWSSGYAAGINV